jgi:hypothetical protein
VLAHQGVSRVGVSDLAAIERQLRQNVATDRSASSREIREADRSRASGPPLPGEGTIVPAIGERSATLWVDRLGREKAVGLEDVLIIAPYRRSMT